MPPAFVSAAMCLLVIMTGKWLVFLPLLVRLAIQILVGVLSYTALAGIFQLQSFRYLWDMAMSRMPRKEAK